MRQVRPTILPLRLRIAEIRWSVRSMPARLSSPNVPMWSTTWAMSPSSTSRSSSVTSLSGKRASGRRPSARMVAVALRSRRDHAESVSHEGRGIDVRASDDLQVVRLVLLGDADLEKPVELRAVLAATRRFLHERLDIGEAQDRCEAGPRNTPLGPLALPVRKAKGL